MSAPLAALTGLLRSEPALAEVLGMDGAVVAVPEVARRLCARPASPSWGPPRYCWP